MVDKQKFKTTKKSDLSKFYIQSGVRENVFCVKNPKYWMGPLPSNEARERAGLRGAGYRGPIENEEINKEFHSRVRKLKK